ncbi:unnamed protein product [Protopolystoma xenopodis]|uniref:Coiled-coil domain-containing protein n=1 Tax=Protopolystoma xenopodis TaxID=117903 RepID=A0A3S4ZDK1_9PLAT|nr:unnamed protein product [Protopolystoma xenopodis]
MPTTMPAKRLGMHHVQATTLQMIMHTMDSGLVICAISTNIMPKKLTTNTKSLEARERRAAKKLEEREKKEIELANEYWKDDDKIANRKKQRQEEKETKKNELVARKKEREELYEKELALLKSAKENKPKAELTKLTQYQIDVSQQRLLSVEKQPDSKDAVDLSDTFIEENLNRVIPDGLEARTVEDAISILDLARQSDPGDNHPEKRMKAAFSAYLNKRLPEMKAEFPSMRHSQLKERIFKEFQTSAENPKNKSN